MQTALPRLARALGSDAELAGAFLINLPAWGANCGRTAQGTP